MKYTIKDNETQKEFHYSEFQFNLAFAIMFVAGFLIGITITSILIL